MVTRQWAATGITSKGPVMTVDNLMIKHVRHAVDSRLSGAEAAIFDTQDHATPSYTRNTDCWAADIDLTPISPWNSGHAELRAGTLVSPRHIIFANHYPIDVSATVRFVAADNTVANRTMTARQRVGTTDIMVGVLSSDVPASIGFAKVLPSDWTDYLPSLGYDVPVLVTDQQEKALVFDWAACDASDGDEGLQLRTPFDATRLGFREAIVDGDSGNPVCLIVDDELVLLSTLYTNQPAGPCIHDNATDINAAMTSLGGGYSLTEADLSGFTDYGR
jgi:hypothetical protein